LASPYECTFFEERRALDRVVRVGCSKSPIPVSGHCLEKVPRPPMSDPRHLFNTPAAARRFLRRPPIGRAWLRLRRALDFGPAVEIRTLVAKHRYLRAVLSLPPLESDTGPVDCFMLLNEPRIWEGLWSLYSFRAHFGPCRIVVLSDGTLRRSSIGLLTAIFPGISIPDCETNDRKMDTYLAQQGLRRCREWRKSFIFFRKLVDTVMLRQAASLLLLDSDCLHFRVPVEIRRWVERPSPVRYAADVNQYSHCAVSYTHLTLPTICSV